jgi:RHS repeat-associated protein
MRCRFPHTGQEFDIENGQYYYRARYYDQTTSRFLSEDPLEFGGDDVDFYVYAYDDPANFVDPSGLNGQGTATVPPPVKSPPQPKPEPPPPITEPPPGLWPGIGAILGRGGILFGLGLLLPPATNPNDQPHPGLYDPNCKTGKNHPCYKQYEKDEEWCREKFLNNDAMYDYCMRIADLNLQRCLDGLPRAPRDPNDPRYIRKHRK